MQDERRVPCDDALTEEGDRCLTKKERERILSRIHSLLFWVGEMIPDSYEIDGKMVPLREIIFKIITDTDVTEQDISDAKKLAVVLESEARRLEREIVEDDSLSRKDAHTLLDEVLGLLRAVDELRGLDKEQAEFKKKAIMKKVDDERRWLNFVKNFNR